MPQGMQNILYHTSACQVTSVQLIIVSRSLTEAS